MALSIDDINKNAGKAVKFDDILKVAPVGTIWDPNDSSNYNEWISLGKLNEDGVSDSAYFEKGDTYYSFGNEPEAIGTGNIAGDIEFTSVTISNRTLREVLSGRIFDYGDDGVSFFTQRKSRQATEYAFVGTVRIGGIKKVFYIARGILSQTGETAYISDNLVNVSLAITPLAYEGGVTVTDYDIDNSNSQAIVTVSSKGTGALDPDKVGSNVVNLGDTFTVSVDSGTIKNWLLNGASTGQSGSSFTISNIDDNYSITAIFETE